MAEKLTATQRKILERRVKTSILMAGKTSKADISSETGVTVRTVNKDIQWVIDNPSEIRKAGGKAASKRTVDLYLNGGPTSTGKKKLASTQVAQSNNNQSNSSDSPSGNNTVNSDDNTETTSTLTPTDSKTNSDLIQDYNDAPVSSDNQNDEIPTENVSNPGWIADSSKPNNKLVDTNANDQDQLDNDVTTEEIPVTDPSLDGTVRSKSTEDVDVESASAPDADEALAGENESTSNNLTDEDADLAGKSVEVVDSDNLVGNDDLKLGESSSVMMIGASSGNGLISIGTSPVKTTKTYTEVVSLDTPDSIDPKVREKLEESRVLMELPEENDDDTITYHTRKLTNLVRDGVMNSDDSVNKESLGHAFKVVLSNVFGHKSSEDGYGDLDEWFQEWDEDIPLTEDEMAFQDLSHRMKTEYMKARIREDRVMIVFIGLVAIILIVATLFAIGFNLFG